MKTLKTLLFIFILIICSLKLIAQIECPTPDSVINFLKRGWIWRYSLGGWGNLYPDSIGYTKKIYFEEIADTNNKIKYHFYKNDTIIAIGTPMIIEKKIAHGNVWALDSVSTIYKGYYELLGLVFKNENEIILVRQCWDCFEDYYDRDDSVNKTDGVELNINRNDKIIYYPNPVKDRLIIKNYDFQQVEIININGIKVISKPFESIVGDEPIDVSLLEKGIYFIRIITKYKVITGTLLKL